uniref:DNA repair protein complementing XP-G cells n=1 Tax=Schistocephalus solidus TaxID=70667 RepID=A0A0X3PI05_SCHSO
MGVPGLWKLLEAARRKVDLEQFRGKKIAIDMNIWLHQALKSRGAEGTRNPNFYLSILFRRICKLLFFGIKPVFVFDGAVPDLKKATLAVRRTSRQNLQAKSNRARGRLLTRILHRLAKAETDRKSTKDLSAELLQRLQSSEDARRAELDRDMFGLSSSEYSHPESGAISALEDEQESAASLARDFLDGFSDSEDIDFESEAFAALPTPAQLHVLLILQRHLILGKLAGQKALAADGESSTGDAFSTLQLNRLILRRKLTLKQAQIHQLLDKKAVREVVSSLDSRTADLIRANFSGDLGVQVQASRIVSQDQGHAILLNKKPSMKPSAVSTLERLKRLVNAPCPEPGIEVTSDAIPMDSVHHVSYTREGSPPKELVELNFALRGVEDISMNPQGHPKPHSPPSCTSEAVDLVTLPSTGPVPLSEPISHLSPKNCLLSVETFQERSPTAATFAEQIPHSAQGSFSSPVKFHVVDGGTESLNQKSQDFSIPVGNMSTVDPARDDRISEHEISSSEDDETGFIDVEEVFTSSSPPSTAVTLTSTQECLSNRVLQGINADDGNLHEVTMAVQNEINVDTPNTTDVAETSFWGTLVGSEEEDNFEFDDEFLRAEADRMERLAQQTSNDVIAEAQRLLFLFGLPFIVSPEEAEAQCCRLQQLGLVDVVASDDSDVWLFGARLVIRHLFATPKGSFTAAYSAEDIQRLLGLDRTQFLRIALLCGSDYTTGVPKIGPVKAMEILAEFAADRPSELPSSCPAELTIKSRIVSSVLEPLVNFRTTVMNAKQPQCPSSKSSPPKCRWRSISMPNDFPNATVVEAYLSPNVDLSASEFIWNEPQVSDLVKYPFLPGANAEGVF